VSGTLRSAQAVAKKAARTKGAIPSQIPPVVKWRDRLVEMEYDLQTRLLTLSDEAPEIAKLKAQIDITRKQMQSEIERYMRSVDINGALDGSALSIPSLIAQKVGLEAQIHATSRLANLAPSESIQLTRLVRDLASRSAILQQLQGQYEIAKVQEGRNPNKWEVLDEPWVDDRPVNKGLLRATAASMFLGLFLGCFVAALASKRASTAKSRQDDDSLPLAA
jgi:uncharacterized protein involved in exopolysaccharide biosynthesis